MYHIEEWNESTQAWEHRRSFLNGPTALAVWADIKGPGMRVIHTIDETFAA